MQYANQQSTFPSTRKLLAPVVALVIGVAGVGGAYALIENDGGGQPASRAIADSAGQPNQGLGAKNEAAIAAAIGGGAGTPSSETKDEAATAAAIGSSGTPSSETKDEAATAAAIAPSSESDPREEAERANRTDPHGPASALP